MTAKAHAILAGGVLAALLGAGATLGSEPNAPGRLRWSFDTGG